MSPTTVNGNGRGHAFARQQTPGRSLIQPVHVSNQHWTHQQELKVKITCIPRGCWTVDVYHLLSRYGHIFRIEMQPSDGSAWVNFQPPPKQPFWNYPICLKGASLKITIYPPRILTVPSPIKPARQYQGSSIVYANAIDFGVAVGDKKMMKMRTADALNRVQVMLNLRRKEIDIKFPFIIDDEERKYRFRLPISQLGHMYKAPDSSGQQALVIPFNSPPRFYRQAKAEDIPSTFKPSEKVWYEWNSWYRQTDVVDGKTSKRMQFEPVMNHKDSAIIDIGRWTTYRLLFHPSTLTESKFAEFSNALADHNVQIQDTKLYSVTEKTTTPLWSLLQEEMSSTHPHIKPSSSQSAFDDLVTNKITLSFPVRYQLEACLSNGWLKEQNITRDFLERLVAMDPLEAVYILENVDDKKMPYYDSMEIFNIRIKEELTKKLPNYCVLTRAANITPTMIRLTTPVVETSNRIVRRYMKDAENFLRVKFSDEKTEGKIGSQDDDRSEEIFRRVRRAMAEGIVVAGRYYEFLAFGNSQFREHGAYFFAPTSSISADDIRRSMGTFDHIKTPSKFGARIGQCFSTTRHINSMRVRIEQIADIERNGYTFTDGVGKISTLVAQMSAQELGLQSPFDDYPSLFQFRLAGCKGVLTVDPKLTGSVVHIRPSQYKFKAENSGLEVIRASAFATAVFNRQLIIVLSTLGVPDQAFILKQQQMVNDLERATKEESVALVKLQRNIDVNQMTLTMAAMILDGFVKSREPFMMSLLELWRAFHIKSLKEKARIVIEKGAFVLGCVDETARLRGHFDNPQALPGATREEKLATLPEIFIQISNPDKKGHYKIIEGICILARNPSLHPGDIRVVRAVDVSTLHHLKNVVVLPQTGDRDIANMCSGGDLDGDDYLVMWDMDFLPTYINELPMDFTPEKPEELDRPITVKDITDFFVTYMKNDSLARIALAHLAQADFNESGVRDDKCLELARLHSQAVDYPKSGIPAIMGRELKPQKWPHFMESKYRTENQKYHSKGILGQLYDQVKLVDFKPRYENQFDSRILNAFQLDDVMLQQAKTIKDIYDSSLIRLMAKHDIRTEFEAWSTFVLSHNQETRDYSFAEEFGKTVGAIKHQFQEICREAAGARGANDFERIAPFVAAMYTVTADEMKEALKQCRETNIFGYKKVPVRKMDPEHMPLMSFPWLFVNELGKIATGDVVDRQDTMVQQSVAKKHPGKHADFTLEYALGDIETKAGVIHIGEPLKLFGDAPRTESPICEDQVIRHGPASSQQDAFHRLDLPHRVQRVADRAAIAENDIRRSPPDELPLQVEGQSSWDVHQAVAPRESEDSGSTQSGIQTPDGSDETDDEYEDEEVNIDLENGKPSAVDRLAKLLES
ncbi:RdRP-domain-containing protein [Zopfia rhizophila CBS 207.26]|uniref:RNA-dependent RNA polymerase n=1 Tax=Zopfia rhizophila CBS 207.26 TaxID=1314779 RepID=A0A6A6DDW1_9PEZI|nr:RdRP-domain-containing protein [Zopfia rhizophila CBS 207.26]